MRRPFTRLAAAGAIAHHGYELACGTGLVFQPWLGLGGAAAVWGAVFPAWLLAAGRGPRWDRPLAFASGMSLGASAMHYTLWPWERRGPLPYLVEAEGLRPRQLPAYNAILWTWAVAASVALARESSRWALPWALAGVAAVAPLRRTARGHFVWMRAQALERRAWWNRAFAGAAA